MERKKIGVGVGVGGAGRRSGAESSSEEVAAAAGATQRTYTELERKRKWEDTKAKAAERNAAARRRVNVAAATAADAEVVGGLSATANAAAAAQNAAATQMAINNFAAVRLLAAGNYAGAQIAAANFVAAQAATARAASIRAAAAAAAHLAAERAKAEANARAEAEEVEQRERSRREEAVVGARRAADSRSSCADALERYRSALARRHAAAFVALRGAREAADDLERRLESARERVGEAEREAEECIRVRGEFRRGVLGLDGGLAPRKSSRSGPGGLAWNQRGGEECSDHGESGELRRAALRLPLQLSGWEQERLAKLNLLKMQHCSPLDTGDKGSGDECVGATREGKRDSETEGHQLQAVEKEAVKDVQQVPEQHRQEGKSAEGATADLSGGQALTGAKPRAGLNEETCELGGQDGNGDSNDKRDEDKREHGDMEEPEVHPSAAKAKVTKPHRRRGPCDQCRSMGRDCDRRDPCSHCLWKQRHEMKAAGSHDVLDDFKCCFSGWRADIIEEEDKPEEATGVAEVAKVADGGNTKRGAALSAEALFGVQSVAANPPTKREISFERKWQNKYEALVAFNDKHGHMRPKKGDPKNKHLQSWCFTQQATYGHLVRADARTLDRISRRRIELLKKIDFPFGSARAPQGRIEDKYLVWALAEADKVNAGKQWSENFAKLRRLVTKGRTIDELPLGEARKWANNQRVLLSNISRNLDVADPVTRRRVEILDGIGFTWFGKDGRLERSARTIDAEAYVKEFETLRQGDEEESKLIIFLRHGKPLGKQEALNGIGLVNAEGTYLTTPRGYVDILMRFRILVKSWSESACRAERFDSSEVGAVRHTLNRCVARAKKTSAALKWVDEEKGRLGYFLELGDWAQSVEKAGEKCTHGQGNSDGSPEVIGNEDQDVDSAKDTDEMTPDASCSPDDNDAPSEEGRNGTAVGNDTKGNSTKRKREQVDYHVDDIEELMPPTPAKNERAADLDRHWAEMYTKVCAFGNLHGHLKVRNTADPKLYRWMCQQRIRFNKAAVGEEPESALDATCRHRICLLKKIRFQWRKGNDVCPDGSSKDSALADISKFLPPGPKRHGREATFDRKWAVMYSRLCEACSKYGHTRISKRFGDEKLKNFVVGQRGKYHRLVLGGVDEATLDPVTRHRIRLLNDISFQWKPDVPYSLGTDKTKIKERHDAWLSRFEELKELKKETGNLRPKRGTPLQRWLEAERSKLALLVGATVKLDPETKEKVDLLSQIGISWHKWTDENFWRRMEELKEYESIHGNCNVPTKKTSLGLWVKGLRYDYKQHCKGEKPLAQWKIDALNEINFKWSLVGAPKQSLVASGVNAAGEDLPVGSGVIAHNEHLEIPAPLPCLGPDDSTLAPRAFSFYGIDHGLV